MGLHEGHTASLLSASPVDFFFTSGWLKMVAEKKGGNKDTVCADINRHLE